MHLIVCGVGTALAMAGHLRRPRLWTPHVVGLLIMVAVSYDVGGSSVRWVGAAALLALTLAVLPGVEDRRGRVDAVIDSLAMVVLIAAAPMTGGHGMAGHAMGGGAMSEPSAGVAVAVATLLAWAGARILVLRLANGLSRAPGRPTPWTVVALAGSALMVTGMTLMSV